jgi:hypothetical protein
MSTNSATNWARYGGHWYRLVDANLLRAKRDIEACDDWLEVLAFDLVDAERWSASARPADPSLRVDS